MSAKDKAFESERGKYRQKIRALELDNQKILEREYLLRDKLWKTQDELRSKEEHVNRLLEYMDYQPEEPIHKVMSEKTTLAILGTVGAMGRIYRN